MPALAGIVAGIDSRQRAPFGASARNPRFTPCTMTEPYSTTTAGIRIAVRLTPSSSADRVEGVGRLSDGSAVLAARVRAVPEDGQANKALEKLVAKALRVPRSAVSVVGGHKARQKQLAVDGDPAVLLDLVRRLWPSVGDGGEK